MQKLNIENLITTEDMVLLTLIVAAIIFYLVISASEKPTKTYRESSTINRTISERDYITKVFIVSISDLYRKYKIKGTPAEPFIIMNTIDATKKVLLDNTYSLSNKFGVSQEITKSLINEITEEFHRNLFIEDVEGDPYNTIY